MVCRSLLRGIRLLRWTGVCGEGSGDSRESGVWSEFDIDQLAE